MKLFTTRRRIAIVSAVAVALAGGGAAFAYFTSSGSGTGSATVGSAGAWAVTQHSTSGTIYPGAGSSTIVFDVQNSGNGDQQYSSATVAVNASTQSGFVGDITVSGLPVAGCLANWFNAAVGNDPAINTNVAASATVQVSVTVSMPSDQTDNQNACQGKQPDVTLTIG